MEVTNLQLATLRNLLKYFIGLPTLSNNEATQIYKFIFSERIEISFKGTEELLEAITYLKLIATEHQFSDITSLKVYYESRLAKLSSRLDKIREDTKSKEKNRLIMPNNLEDGKFLVWQKETRVLNSDQDISPDLPLGLSEVKHIGHGSFSNCIRTSYFSNICLFDLNMKNTYDRECKDIFWVTNLYFLPTNYLKEFSPDNNYGKIFLGNSLGKDVDEYRVPPPSLFISSRNIVDLKEYEWFLKALRERLEILYYDIFDVIKSEVPITSDKVKRQLTTWISSTKCFSIWASHSDSDHLKSFYEGFWLPRKYNWKYDNDILSRFETYYETKFRDRDWEILKSPPGSHWLTSDNPGFILRNKQVVEENSLSIAQHLWDQIDDDADLYYPLSKQYCLRIHEKKTKADEQVRDSVITFVESTVEECKKVNQFTFLTHSHFVIAGDKSAFEELQTTK